MMITDTDKLINLPLSAPYLEVLKENTVSEKAYSALHLAQ